MAKVAGFSRLAAIRTIGSALPDAADDHAEGQDEHRTDEGDDQLWQCGT